MSADQLYSRIYRELEGKMDEQNVKLDKKFHKYEGHREFGIRSPKLKKILKSFQKEIQQLKREEVFELAKYLYKDEIEESVLAGNFVLYVHLDFLDKSSFSILDKVSDHFISWSTVDDFCIKVLQPLIFQYPKETLKYLKQWNKSENMWKRRTSVVAFVRKVGESGKFTDEALSLCSNLIDDEKDLVQKGVGWCLKDVMRGDKEKVTECVKGLRRKGVSSTITLYAIRDLKGKERKEILKVKPQ